ncbi:MAG: hypothetical protein LBH24_02820, partial [Clostridiales bacterium]|nr:hypothetical protein [Clostridiales bacterium]
DPEIEIDNKSAAGGWHSLASPAVNPTGTSKTGTMLWSSSDPSVAAIDPATGALTYVGAGETVITVSDGAVPTPGADSFRLGVYDDSVTQVFDFGGITNANAESKGVKNLSGGVTVNSAAAGLHSGSVDFIGVKAEALATTSYPGIDVSIPMQAGATYTIRIKIRLLAFNGTDQQIVARHTAAGGPALIGGAAIDLRQDPLSDNGEYIFVINDYTPVNVVAAGTQNIAFYLRSPSGNNAVSASLVFSDLMITRVG